MHVNELKAIMFRYLTVYRDYTSYFQDPPGAIIGEGDSIEDSLKDLVQVFDIHDSDGLIMPYWFGEVVEAVSKDIEFIDNIKNYKISKIEDKVVFLSVFMLEKFLLEVGSLGFDGGKENLH